MPTLSYIWSLKKITPFGGCLPVWAIIGCTPPPPPGTVEVSYQSHRTHKIIYKVSIRSLKIRKYDKLSKQPRSISGTCLPRFNWDQAFLLLFFKKRDIMDDILRKQPAFATPSVVSPRNDVWETSAEIPYWWRVTAQIWAVLLIGWSKFSANQEHYPDLGSDTSSVWNFCARFSDVISRGDHQWRREMSAVFSGYRDKGKVWSRLNERKFSNTLWDRHHFHNLLL